MSLLRVISGCRGPWAEILEPGPFSLSLPRRNSSGGARCSVFSSR